MEILMGLQGTAIEKLRSIVSGLSDRDVDGFVLATATRAGDSIEVRVQAEAEEGEMTRKLDEATRISSWHPPEEGDGKRERRW